MQTQKLRKLVFLLAASLLIVGLLVQFGLAGGKKEPKEVIIEKEVMVSGPFSSAARAVEEAKKYSGTNLTVVWEAGLQSQDPKTFGPKWEQLTGIKIRVIEMSYNDIYSNQLQDHLTGGSSYDVITFSPLWLIDFVKAGIVEPLNPYIDKYMNEADMDDYLDVYKSEGYARMGDTWYGLPDDGDVFVLYYRKDLFEDPKNMADFKARYGYDLAPPRTWDQFNDIGKFFTEKFAPGLYGGAIQRLEGQVYSWWMGAFSGNGGKFFDPNTMKTGVNSEAGIKTLQQIVDQNKWMPPGIEKWGFVEVLSAWMDGKVAMIITWPPIGRWSAGYGATVEQLAWVPSTKVAGKVGYVPPPGRPTLAGGFSLGVSPDSKKKDAAYLFIQWMNSPEISLQRVMLPYALRDPFRISHFESPLYASLWPQAPEYLQTLKEGALKGQFELGIPGAREYAEAIDNACTSAFAGTSPRTALDKAARRWMEITERLGIEEQKKNYALWLNGPWNKEGPK